MSEKIETQELIELELGQIIKIISPKNENYHNKIYIIDYLDENLMKITDESKEQTSLKINEGKIIDESIENIVILNYPNEKGFARQNGYIPGKWISIEFGGAFPKYFNGQITDLEEDQIEINIHESDIKIYIDFAYKGIPLDLEINSISFIPSPEQQKQIDKDETNKKELKEELDSDDDDIILPFYNTEDNELERQEIIFEADQIQYGKKLESVTEIVDVEDDSLRFDVDTQTKDLYQEMLSNIPIFERNNTQNLSYIQKTVNRYIQLRKDFTIFDENNLPVDVKKRGAKHKPFINNLYEFKNVPLWIIPVVKNRKKLHDLNETNRQNMNSDSFNEDGREFIQDMINKHKMYMDDDFPSEQNKYVFYNNSLDIKPYDNNFTNTKNIIINKNISNDLTTILNNLSNFESSTATFEKIGNDDKDEYTKLDTTKFAIQKYITSSSYLKLDLDTKTYYKEKFTEDENLYLKGFIVLPESIINYSNLYLPNTNIYDKTEYHDNHFQYWKFLNENTSVKINKDVRDLTEDNPNKHDFNFLVSEKINYYPFKERTDYEERIDDNPDIYKEWLNSLVPKTRVLLDKFKKYIKNPYSYTKIIETLEPFNVHPDDIYHFDVKRDNYSTYEIIKNFIEVNILNYKNQLKDNVFSYNKYLQSTFEYDIKSNLFTLFEEKKLKDLNLQHIDKNTYNLDGEDTNDYLNITNEIDCQKLFLTAVSLVSIELAQPIDIDEKLSTLKFEMEQQELEDSETRECKTYTLAKKYKDMDDLLQDNDKEIYFDKQLDPTQYDIYKSHKDNIDHLTDEQQLEALKTHLMSNVGLDENTALRDAIAMIIEKREVLDGDYAVLDQGDYDFRYFFRDGDKWKHDRDMVGMDVNEINFCNMQNKCMKIKNICATDVENRDIIQRNLLKDIQKNFDNEIKSSFEQLEKDLLKKLEKCKENIKLLKDYQSSSFLKNDTIKLNLGNTVLDLEKPKSPYSNVRDIILGDSNIIDMYDKISIFCDNYCREYDKFNPSESMYWYYCIKTNLPLLPTFLKKLANAFDNDTYDSELQKIISERGSTSDDGDKIIDKFSGYTITNIEYDTAEGYNKQGFKILSRYVEEDEKVEKDMDNVLNYKSPEARKIYTMIKKFDNMLGLDTSEQFDFIINLTLEMLKPPNLSSEEDYNKEQKEKLSKKKIKKIKPYVDFYDTMKIKILICTYAIGIQSCLKHITSKKTYVNCKKSFSGFPFFSSVDTTFIEYITCVILKLKNDERPYNTLPRIKNNAKGKDKKKKFDTGVQAYMKQFLMSKQSVLLKQQEKKEWLEQNKIETKSEIYKFDNSFLPPLKSVKVNSVQNIGPNYERKLKDSVLKNNIREFLENRGSLEGKITSFSLAIQEGIQRIINNEPLLLNTIAGQPFVENSCCYKYDQNSYEFFINKDSPIKTYNENLHKLKNLKYKYINFSRSPTFISTVRSKDLYVIEPNVYSENVIYQAFIKFCNFNSGITLDEDIMQVCSSNTSKMTGREETLEEKIRILKDDGYKFSEESLIKLISIISRKNIIDLDINNQIVTPKTTFEKLLNTLIDTSNDTCITNIIKSLLNLLDRFRLTTDKHDDEFKLLITILNEQIDKMEDRITDLLKMVTRPRYVKKIFDNLKVFEERGDDIYLFKADETGYFQFTFFCREIHNILRIYPNMIKNDKILANRDKIIPQHWHKIIFGKGETDYHKGIIVNHVKNELKDLKKYSKNKNVSKIIDLVLKEKDILAFINNIPFISGIKQGDKILNGALNGELLSTLSYYFYLCSLCKYIDTIDSDYTTMFDEEEYDEETNRQYLLSEKEKNKEFIANILYDFLKITNTHKKDMDYSNSSIKSNMEKIKEKEKEEIKMNLRKMDEESLRVQDLMKKHKLGDWSVGQTEAIYKYDSDYFGSEYERLRETLLKERESGKIDEVSRMQAQIFGIDLHEVEAQEINDMSNVADYDDDDGELHQYNF